ncbi:indole-3-glycerol-phosphate synthase [Aureococcus anophagefferens]|nr:indole-3-glycerol-phosphate synthase [Aureococcus anophagefferens]
MSTLQTINALRGLAETRDAAYERVLCERVAAVDAAVGAPMDGPINVDAAIADVASLYASAGASLISVLTEPDWFQGSLDDLYAAREAVHGLGARRPALLRKDFVSRPVQVLEARAYGADCVLLIVACLEKSELRALVEACAAQNIMALVEVHTEAEMALALDCPGVECIGINNRNLHSFKLDIGVSMRSEVVALKDVECVLVGEALMRSSDPALVAELKGTVEASVSVADEATRPLAKVCGVTSVADALAACRAGADLIGVINVAKSKRHATAATAKAIVDAVREYGERSGPWAAPASEPSLEAWAARLRRDTARGRPLVVGVAQDQPLGDVLDFVDASGVDCVQLHGTEDAAYAAALPVPHLRVLHAPALLAPRRARQRRRRSPAKWTATRAAAPSSSTRSRPARR